MSPTKLFSGIVRIQTDRAQRYRYGKHAYGSNRLNAFVGIARNAADRTLKNSTTPLLPPYERRLTQCIAASRAQNWHLGAAIRSLLPRQVTLLFDVRECTTSKPSLVRSLHPRRGRQRRSDNLDTLHRRERQRSRGTGFRIGRSRASAQHLRSDFVCSRQFGCKSAVFVE